MTTEDVKLFQLENVVPTEKIVGSGAYGRVLEVSTLSAAKELHHALTDFASPQGLLRLQQKFLAECHQCSKLCHPNIVQFLGVYYPSKDAKLPWLVMEKMDCSLTDYLDVHKPNEVSFQTRISILHDVTLGLQYLHVQDIIHRDLSSNNILLTKQLVAKIADLGVAKVIDPNRTKSHSQAPGTIIFMPPEALLVRPRYGKPVDVFSLGCVMMHMMTHIWPVPTDEVCVDEITGKKIARDEIERREDYLKLIQEPEQLKELILRCLNNLPEKQPSISDISEVFRELKPDLKVEKMYSILFEYEPLLLLKDKLTNELGVTKAEAQDKPKKEQEATAQAQEMFNTYETTVQQLRSEKYEIEKQKKQTEAQMQDGYKEREDRIAELEEFINDQVAELDKMDAAMKQTVANKQILEKDYQKLREYYNSAKKLVEQYENRHIAQEEKISQLEFASRRNNEKLSDKIRSLEEEKEALIQSNEKLSTEVARLMTVDNDLQNRVKEIEQCELELHKAQEELQTKTLKENQLTAEGENNNQQSKENRLSTAVRIKNLEEEKRVLSEEVRVEKEEIMKYKLILRKAEEELQTKEFMLNIYKEDFDQERKDRENAHSIKEEEIGKMRIQMEKFEAECQEKVHNVEAELISLRKHGNNHYIKENEKLKKECAMLHAELDKERKDAQDRFKNKTEQFQLQWRKREEAEAQVHTLTEQLNTQSELNKQLNSTIDALVRKSKGIEPQMSPKSIANQKQPSRPQQASPHPFNPPFLKMSSMDTQSDQHHVPTATSRSHYDSSVDPGKAYYQQPPPSSTSQPVWQRQLEHQQQLYAAQQLHQEQLHIRGQERESSHNQPVKPLHEGTQYPPDYQGKKYIPPANHQPRSMQPTNIDNHQLRSIQPEYNIAGANAAPLQGKLPYDDYNYYGSSGGSVFSSSSFTKPVPAPYQSPLTASRRPQRFDSNLQLDPYLICPKCKLQFREGQLPEYRHHIDNCHH